MADPVLLSCAAVVAIAVLVALAESLWPGYRQEARQGRRIVANFGLGLFDLVTPLLLPLSTGALLETCRMHGFGLFNALNAPLWLIIPASVAIASLTGYFAHVAQHRIPVLWRFHAIHHSDPELDYSTALRHHPATPFIGFGLTAPVMALCGLHAPTIVALGILYWLVNIVDHANVRLPARLNTALAWIVITPNMHAVHHSTWQPETDSNYGALFSGWDRLFGTLREDLAGRGDSIRFGLAEFDPRASRDLATLLLRPLRRNGRETRPEHNLPGASWTQCSIEPANPRG